MQAKPRTEFRKFLENRAYRYAAALILFFFITAVFGSLLGGWIDRQFSIAPWGNVITLFMSYTVSWIFVKFVILKRLNTKRLNNNKSE